MKPKGSRPRFAIFSTSFESSLLVIRALFQSRLGPVLPLLVLLLMMAAVLGVIALVPSIAPFVYPLF